MTFETTRRSLLKGVTLGAGATLLSPILDQIAAHAAGDARAVRKRFVFVVQTNGMMPGHIVPVGVAPPSGPKASVAQDAFSEVALKDHELPAPLEPLKAFKDRMTLVMGLSGRVASSGHSCNQGALGCYSSNRIAGPTIDHAVSEALPGVMRHVALGTTDFRRTMNYSLIAAGPNRAVPVVCSQSLAFRTLFGSAAEGNEGKEFSQQANLLDFMADDVRRTRSALPGEEKQKLDGYLEAFEALRDRHGRISGMQADLRRQAPKLGDRISATANSVALEAQFDMGAAALIAGLTNVLTLTSSGGDQGGHGNYPELGIADGHHIGHGGGYGDKTYAQCFVEIRQFHTRLIADLARKLQAVPEGNGTMLDNTLIVYLSDCADSHHPNCYNWPMVLIGNIDGKLRTDRYVVYPRYQAKGHRTIANMYVTLLQLAGVKCDTFGMADPNLKDLDQKGPLAELLA
jgi:hypothetical protein